MESDLESEYQNSGSDPDEMSGRSEDSDNNEQQSATEMEKMPIRQKSGMAKVISQLSSYEDDVIEVLFAEHPELANKLVQMNEDYRTNRDRREELTEETRLKRCVCHMCPAEAHEGEDQCCGIPFPNCIIRDDFFNQYVLGRNALMMAIRKSQDTWSDPNANYTNKGFRHHAYRNYIYWRNGVTGRYNRQPLPACVYNVIRQTYPEPNNAYTHYKDFEDYADHV